MKQIRIAFSGVDGSGKTTQARLLFDALQQHYGADAVAYSHGNRPLFTADVKGRAARTVHYRSRPVFIALGVLTKDMLKIWMFVLQHRKKRIIIFDRYIDDAIAKLRFSSRPLPAIERCARFCTPRATVVLWLDVPPAVSCARDKEHPLVYHERKHQQYAEVFTKYSWTKQERFSGEEDPSAIHARVKDFLQGAGII